MKYQAIVIGVSAGGLNALFEIFNELPASFPIPIIVVQHLYPQDVSSLSDILNKNTDLKVIEATDKLPVLKNYIYIAPPNYHLLMEKDHTFSLSTDNKVNFSRPSIDVMFESAASVYADRLIGIVLTGANGDGAKGLKTIKKYGGYCIAQDPKSAEFSTMPLFAINSGAVDEVLTLKEISILFKKLNES